MVACNLAKVNVRVRFPLDALMLENLKLPLCPKCGDTKNVKDKNDYSQCVIHQPNYECLTCEISWTPYKIVDNKTGTLYSCHGEMPSRRYVYPNPKKWCKTLTEDVR